MSEYNNTPQHKPKDAPNHLDVQEGVPNLEGTNIGSHTSAGQRNPPRLPANGVITRSSDIQAHGLVAQIEWPEDLALIAQVEWPEDLVDEAALASEFAALAADDPFVAEIQSRQERVLLAAHLMAKTERRSVKSGQELLAPELIKNVQELVEHQRLVLVLERRQSWN